MGLGPFDLTGGPFLTLYGALFVLTFIAGLAIPRWLRPEGRPTPGVSDPERLAYLAGGKTRFGEALIARLFSISALAIRDGKLVIHANRAGRNSAERSVLALPSPADWSHVTGAITQDAEAIDRKLESQGLLYDHATAWQMRFWQAAPYAVLLMFGAIKWEIGVSRDRPVGYLTAFLIATAICAVIRFVKVDRRTRAGVAVLTGARKRSERLRRAPVREEAGLAVALFGTVVLAGSPWSEVHAFRSSGNSSDGGSSSSSDGGGGCGGGGCGGCGS